MTTARLLTVRLPVTLALVAAVVAVGELAVPAGIGQHLYHDAAQLAAGVVAVAICVAPGRGRAARWWLGPLLIGLTGWTLIRLWWLVQDVADAGRPPGA